MKYIVWSIASLMILFSGVYFSVMLKFPQLKIKNMIKSLFKRDNGRISSFSTLMLTLGGRIGVGSISGIALCIYYGGIGSLFWMFIFSIIGASTTMAETILGLVYRKKEGYGSSCFYLESCSGKGVAIIYSFLILFSYIGGFLGIQTNTIINSLNSFVNVDIFILSFILVILIGFIIFGGLRSIVSCLSKVVPFMTVLYLIISLYVGIKNIDLIPNIFLFMIKDAFKFKPFVSGFMYKVVLGMQRGIFSNESGIGTSVIASSTVDSNDFVKQGYIQMLGVYITSIIICGATAIIILCSDYYKNIYNNINGIEIVQYAFSYHFKQFGNILLFIFIFLFSLSTVLTGYYYGEVSYKYLFKNGSKFVLKLVTLFVLFMGCIMSSGVIWDMVDIMVGLMAIINIYGILKLKDVVKKYTKCYNDIES